MWHSMLTSHVEEVGGEVEGGGWGTGMWCLLS